MANLNLQCVTTSPSDCKEEIYTASERMDFDCNGNGLLDVGALWKTQTGGRKNLCNQACNALTQMVRWAK